MIDKLVDGKLYEHRHWCEFCKCFHSSISCFHPGRNYAGEQKYIDTIRAALDILRPTLPGTFMPDRVRKAIIVLEGVIDET